MESTIKLMEEVYFQCFDLVEKKNDVAYVIEGHGLKETKEEVAVFMIGIDNLEN